MSFKRNNLGSSFYNSRNLLAYPVYNYLKPTFRSDNTAGNQAKVNIKIYIDERLPEEYEKCLVGLNAITKQPVQKIREKIQALSLAKDCYSMKLVLLTNATVVDDAIRFVSSNK
jgi:hypothetical protein